MKTWNNGAWLLMLPAAAVMVFVGVLPLVELRSLLDAFNEAKKTAGLTLVKMLVTGLVLALLAGTIVKIKLFGGPQ